MSPLFCCLYSEPSQSSLDSSHRPTKICTPAPVCSIVPSLLCKAFQTIQLFVTDSSVHFYHVGTLEYLTLYIFNMLQITKLKWFACILAVHMLDSLQIINLSAIHWCMLHVHIHFMSQSSRIFFLLMQIYCKVPLHKTYLHLWLNIVQISSICLLVLRCLIKHSRHALEM